MPSKDIGDIFDEIKAASTKKERVEILQKNNTPQLRTYLRIAFDPIVNSFLPEGKPTFKERNVPFGLGDSSLNYEAKKMYLFVGVNGTPSHQTLKQPRREVLFLQVLESLDNKEREYIVQIKDKKLDIGLTVATINEAIPGLISGEVAETKTKEPVAQTKKPRRAKTTKPKTEAATEESSEEKTEESKEEKTETLQAEEKPKKKKTTRKRKASTKKTSAKKAETVDKETSATE